MNAERKQKNETRQICLGVVAILRFCLLEQGEEEEEEEEELTGSLVRVGDGTPFFTNTSFLYGRKVQDFNGLLCASSAPSLRPSLWVEISLGK